MLLADQRIELDARPSPPSAPVLEAVMVGHCPGGDTPQSEGAQWQRLVNDEHALAQIAELGFTREVARLRRLTSNAQSGEEEIRELLNLPIPVRSLSHFRVLFPFAFDATVKDSRPLSGLRAWLPLAVQDFFESSSALERDQRLLWVIRVREEDGVAAFLPRAGADPIDPDTLGAFDRALLVIRAGLLALPDLERLLMPPAKPVEELETALVMPVFLPCTDSEKQTDSASAHSSSVGVNKGAPEFDSEVLPALLAGALARWRPDMQCLLSLPIEQPSSAAAPRPRSEVLDKIRAQSESTHTAAQARHLQWLYPYLRAPDRTLSSAAGAVAGLQCQVSQREGPWRSAANRPLPAALQPWPPLSIPEVVALRRDPGVTVLLRRVHGTVIDDERLSAPCLSLPEQQSFGSAQLQQEHWRSAEVMRFMGWLRRRLQNLGERLAFDVDIHDPRPAMALRAFFTELHARGALRGARPEQAFRIAQRNEGESTMIFEIEIAPAYPLDLIRITFLQDRHAERVITRVEAING